MQGVLANLRSTLDGLHPADVAHIARHCRSMSACSSGDLVKAEREGDILVETSDAVREPHRQHGRARAGL